jgi:hypothetical protein
LAKSTQQLKTVRIGQAQIKNHDIRTLGHLLPHRRSRFGKQTLDPCAGQRAGENMAGCWIVFYDECNLAHDVRKRLKNEKV